MTRSSFEITKQAAQDDLFTFIQLVHPNRVLGDIHKRVIQWWNKEDAKSYQLLLLPRDHQKSALVAYRVAWMVVKDPSIRILYISSTSNLATKQLKFIKDILTSDKVRLYWPELVNLDEAKREKWTETEISVDHPKRREENVRDPTIYAAGLTTNVVGMHCDIAVLDDVVVYDNAYIEDNRLKLEQQYGLLASIESADAKEWVVGTRYDPRDLYDMLITKTVEMYDDEGQLMTNEPLFEVFQEQVEDRGDGTGQYLWPKQQRYDGKWFGFDQSVLATKKSQYQGRLGGMVQFRAQYYNNPNSSETASITPDMFQYYDRKYLSYDNGSWFFKGKKLNVFASIDFAFSLNTRADYTAIVVVGIDSFNNYYILDIERFKTNLPSEYFAVLLKVYSKWHFRKLRAECTSAQQVIINVLKQDYIKPNGLSFSIEEYRPNRMEGAKEERIEATLQPRYSNRQIWHYQGGHCQTLEEELVLTKPPHDDVKDALASCVAICVPPARSQNQVDPNLKLYHSVFGGIQ